MTLNQDKPEPTERGVLLTKHLIIYYIKTQGTDSCCKLNNSFNKS